MLFSVGRGKFYCLPSSRKMFLSLVVRPLVPSIMSSYPALSQVLQVLFSNQFAFFGLAMVFDFVGLEEHSTVTFQ